MQKAERELIEEKFKGIYALIQSNFDVVNTELRHIKEQTTKTNGRVTCLEGETKVVRFFYKKPIFLALVLLGIFFLASYFDIKELIKLL